MSQSVPTRPTSAKPQPKVNVRHLTVTALLSFVLPLILALAIDLYFDLLPWVTLAAIVIFIPTGSFLVNRAALSEMDRVIETVAPVDEMEMENSEARNDHLDGNPQ